MTVTTAPTPGPQKRAMKSEAMKRDFSTSCHGIAPRIAMFIVRYRAATPAIESRIARGMTRAGIADLSSQVADVVVAPVVIHRDEQRGAKAGEEPVRSA